jgi:hypothetical protein
VTYALAQIEAIADEATRMLLRLEHSIAPVSQLLAGPDQEPLFGPSPNGTTWSERTLIPVVLKFASVSHPKVDTPETRDAIIEMLHELGI